MKTVFFEATWNFETDIADVTFRQRDGTYLNIREVFNITKNS